MEQTTRKILAVSVSVLVAAVAVYGNYLPLQKSKLFLRAISILPANATQDNFREIQMILDEPLRAPSPIGQEEIVREAAKRALGYVTSDGAIPLVDYIEKYYAPIAKSGRGMSFSQNLLMLGLLHRQAFIATGDPSHFQAAKAYFEEGYERGPRRPQFLYALLQMYQAEKNVAGAKKVGEEILSLWPEDRTARESLMKFLKENTDGGN